MLWSRAVEGEDGRLSQGFETRAREFSPEIDELVRFAAETRHEAEQLRELLA